MYTVYSLNSNAASDNKISEDLKFWIRNYIIYTAIGVRVRVRVWARARM